MAERNSCQEVDVVVAQVVSGGGRLWVSDGKLHYRAPPGLLSGGLKASLSALKDQITAKLAGAASPEAALAAEQNKRIRRAPLSFSQLAHWNVYGLAESPCVRQIAGAFHLTGPLKVDALTQSIDNAIRRHDALRTRVLVLEGVPIQEVAEPSQFQLPVEDLAAWSRDLQHWEVLRRIEQLIMEPIPAATGPLLGIRLLRLGEDEHVLAIAMEHMISDQVSLSILTKEIADGYTQARRGHAISMESTPLQFPQYALLQRSSHAAWQLQHGRYWKEQFNGCQRTRFPESRQGGAPGWDVVPLVITTELRNSLREWSRRRQTTPVLAAFTAYAALTLRWCHAPEALFQYVNDGRSGESVRHTIGYLASPLFLRIALADTDTFATLLPGVIQEYCNAYAHADHGYTESLVPRPEYTRNSSFNWIPIASELQFSGLEPGEAISISPVNFDHPMRRGLTRDNEPLVLLYDTPTQIVGGVQYPRTRFSLRSMEAYARNLVAFIERLVSRPDDLVKDIALL